MKFLSFYISQLLDLLPAPEHEALKKDLFAAYECSNDVTKMIDEFIYWIQENENQLVARPSTVLINRVIEDVKKIYGFSMEGNKNTFASDISKDLAFTTDPKMLFIILRNAIDNANKYTHNGTITVSAIVDNESLQIEVADNGSGMNEDLIKALTELQYKDEQVGYKERKSLGFYIMAMLIKKIGGHYIIDSIKGKGTKLSFSLPILKQKKID